MSTREGHAQEPIVSLDVLLEDSLHRYDGNIHFGEMSGSPGAFIFDDEGYYRGFLNTNDTKFGGIIPGPNGMVVGVILRDGSLQNPDGTKSKYTNPVEYLLKTVEQVKTKDNHISHIKRKQ